MSAPAVEVWALPRAGTPVCLADLGDYEVSRVDGELGTVSLTYPPTGEGFALLHEVRKPYVRLPVEVRTDGTAATARRALLMEAKGDSTKPGAPWTFTGLFVGVRMAHASCPYSDDGENGDTVLSGTPGLIVRTLMVRAQARGVLTNVDYSSFSNTLDSNGDPWEKEVTLTFSPGRDYLSILQEMRNKLGVCEWDFTEDDAGADLFLFNPDARGTDRTLPGAQVTLEYGRDFGDGPVTSSNRSVGTHVLGVGVNGMYVEAENPEALAQLGEKIEVYSDFGSVYDEATLDALTEAAAAQAGVGARSYSHDLILGPDSPRPGVDYDVCDWVLRAINGGTERLKVSQLVLRRDNGAVTCSITLGDLIADQEVKTRRMVESLADGSSIVGTSTLRPDVDDGKAPAAPSNVVVSSTAYYDGGTPLATLAASWPAVLTNADGTALDDLSGYEVQYAYQAGQSLPTEWQVAGLTAATSLTWGPVVQARAVDVRVRAQDKYGNFGQWSPVKPGTTASDAAAPPTPATPQVTSYLGILTVFSNGRGSVGQPMPTDTREIEVHISTVGPLFAPDRPVGGLALSSTYVGSLPAAGTFPVAVGAYGTTYYAKLVAVDKTGNASAASAAGSAVLVQAGDGDIGGLSIGKLTAGIMSALMTISGLIRTAASGARVELDTTGLRCIASDGRVLFEFHIPTSLLTIVGKLIAGAGVGLGATVVIDPAIAAMDLHPDATAAKFRKRAFVTSLPGGGTGQAYIREMVTAAGARTGASLTEWANGIRHGLQVSGVYRGGLLVLGSPAGTDGARLTYVDSTTGVNSEVFVERAGGILLTPSGGQEVRTVGPMGTQNFGFHFRAQNGQTEGYRLAAISGVLRFVEVASNQALSDGVGGFKSFVIPHPTESDRWLVHGCTEGPSSGVEYHGTVEVVDHSAVVELPAYFEAATRAEDRHVQVSVLVDDEPAGTPAVHGTPPALGPASPVEPGALDPGIPTLPAVPEWADLPRVAASLPRDGRFRITCSNPRARVAWRVFAVRSDVPQFDVEPLRADVDVHGSGPYRFLTPRRPAA